MVVTPGIEPSHRAYETQVRTTCITMAEGEGFEPPDGFPSSDFKSGALSQTLPALLYGLGGRIRTCDLLNPNQAPYQTRPHQDWQPVSRTPYGQVHLTPTQCRICFT